jgi:DNA polymerase III subunit delta
LDASQNQASTAKPVVYIFHGNDDFALAHAVNDLYEKMGDAGLADLNTARLDARNASEEDIRTAANSLPFLAERRLVILTNAMARFGGVGAQARYQPFLERLPSTTALVLVIADTTERGKWKSLPDAHWLRKWTQQAGTKAHYQLCSLPHINEMPNWIKKQARSMGGTFDNAAALALTAHVANDTRLANLEIDKLLTYVDFRRPVEAEDVEMLTVGSGQTSVFDMVDAMAGGNTTAALRLLHRLLEDQEALSLFGMIVRQFRLLVQVRELMDEGGSVQFATKVMGQPEFVIRKLFGQAQRFSMQRLENIYRRLLAVDEAIKTSSMPAELALDTFIAEVGR